MNYRNASMSVWFTSANERELPAVAGRTETHPVVHAKLLEL